MSRDFTPIESFYFFKETGKSYGDNAFWFLETKINAIIDGKVIEDVYHKDDDEKNFIKSFSCLGIAFSEGLSKIYKKFSGNVPEKYQELLHSIDKKLESYNNNKECDDKELVSWYNGEKGYYSEQHRDYLLEYLEDKYKNETDKEIETNDEYEFNNFDAPE
jgi:succinate dehydrogenase flavin-adding protein (antitoxin of CptAB toxin-antitoxin module)